VPEGDRSGSDGAPTLHKPAGPADFDPQANPHTAA